MQQRAVAMFFTVHIGCLMDVSYNSNISSSLILAKFGRWLAVSCGFKILLYTVQLGHFSLITGGFILSYIFRPTFVNKKDSSGNELSNFSDGMRQKISSFFV